MPRRSVEDLRRYAEQAWQRKYRWSSHIRECYWYSCPGMDPFFEEGGGESHGTDDDPGDYRHDHLYDSTLSRAAIRLASRMSAEVFPPGRDWAHLAEGPAFMPGEQSKTSRGREIDRLQAAIFSAIHSSNFYLAAEQLCLDAVISGTGVMRVGGQADSAHLVSFEPVSQAEVALERGAMGAVWGFHRKLWLTRTEAQFLWPEAKVAGPKDADDAMRRFTVWESTYLDPLVGTWYYDVATGFGERDLERVWEEDLLVCPWVAWRYMLLSGEVQGRSPVMQALPDARTANHAIETRLKAASLRSAGIYTVASGDADFNPDTISFEPGALIPVDSNQNDNPTFRPLDLGGDPQLNELVLSDLRESMERTLLVNQLPPLQSGVRSATEIAERQREAMVALGGPYLRLAEEVGRPVLRAVAYELARKGLVTGLSAGEPVGPGEEPTPLLLDGTDVEVQFVSPLVTAQQLADAETTLRWADMSQRAAGPAAWQGGAKVEDIPEALARKLGVDMELVRPAEERQQAMQQAQAAAPAQGGLPQGEIPA